MIESVFKFRTSGLMNDSCIGELHYEYEGAAQGWCHSPYIVPIYENEGGVSQYELRFKIDNFNEMLDGDGLLRSCTVTGPLYILPKLNIPAINLNLRITEAGCFEPQRCEDLIKDIYATIDEPYVDCDGLDYVYVDRGGFENLFIERQMSIVNSNGTRCTWAHFAQDGSGNIVIDRRGFDDIPGQRSCLITYRYDFNNESGIEVIGSECSTERVVSINQGARSCDDADFSVYFRGENLDLHIEKSGAYGKDRIKLNEYIETIGLDSSAFELIDVASDNPLVTVGYSMDGGYYIEVARNESFLDRTSSLVLTYKNKYLNNCNKEFALNIVTDGYSCEGDIIPNVNFAYSVDGEEPVSVDSISISNYETRISLFITGKYAQYFDINEDECEIPDGVSFIGGNFVIPVNADKFAEKKYKFKFVAEIMNEEYEPYTIYGCRLEQTIIVTQMQDEEIEDIGTIDTEYSQQCETIEPIKSTIIEYEQTDCET